MDVCGIPPGLFLGKVPVDLNDYDYDEPEEEEFATAKKITFNVCTTEVKERCYFNATGRTLTPGQIFNETIELPDNNWYIVRA